jgi:transposase-like protein
MNKKIKCNKCKKKTEHLEVGYRKIFEGQRYRCLICGEEHNE